MQDCPLRLVLQLLESLVTLEEPHLPAELMSTLTESLRNTTRRQDVSALTGREETEERRNIIGGGKLEE